MEPRFRKRDGILNLIDTLEATKVKKSNKDRLWSRPLSPEEVMDKARTAITQHRGDPSNRRHLLGFFQIRKTPSFAKTATKTGSHQPTYSTLAIGTVKNQRPSPMRNGGLCWSKEGMGKKRGDAP
ncbi:ATP-dependent helicase/nuclease subunit A [Dissostichus eleginoides]|uniref:ATP-dependent helicase/nuclease subunit A n=1 Tax=Dissostichus eleginoides TaxID=100907 RepID=A0AAD9FCH4_DISEL|nr:ATP-dependent helicase/nuclease subunit A [Dissostichus eleginoides]